MDVRKYNRGAWNREVERGQRWTVPVDSDAIAAARDGRWEVVLTPTLPVPRSWFPDLRDCDLLCLASGGGQQAPIFAAAGARVTSFDNSPKQLEQDRRVAERDSLQLTTVEGDMADLSAFDDASFDLVFQPVANCFVTDVRPVWREAYRILRPGGAMLVGFWNPVGLVFDYEKSERGILEVRHSIPYSDLTSLTPEELQGYIDREEPLVFGHTLDDQIGGQIDAGFVVTGFFEDRDPKEALGKYIATFIATRATKPGS